MVTLCRVKKIDIKAHIFELLKEKNERARSELYRNSRGIDKYFFDGHLKLESIMEKRLINFSKLEGENYFNEKVQYTLNLQSILAASKLIIDSRILGPWNKYDYLWSCLFSPIINHFLDPSNKCFFYF